ncbi:Serine/threonine-protein phosphatase 2A regulatory subunit B'' subunit alpha [Habropoda laboriosa]|uniref:Serine/threonine-protein phosphatase 2A regulatory subunit B'' subunit alpha n=1 Tax=Habropoda laboriosa TaxID=597456 RepID=A0A0L7RI96_9HYME|nr:Serine/threonine-protein phosphatase 2A regulatory subunit B'' subunit alpha [Habropoda laboriosa]
MPASTGSVITETTSSSSSSSSSATAVATSSSSSSSSSILRTETASSGGVASHRLAIEIETIERRVCATRRDLFVPVTVDPRPSRAVHCPDLNACLVNESRSSLDQVDCQAIHFGYAIPVNVVPLENDPGLAELVLDHSSELSRRAASFLLEHHPQLRQQTQQDMAATAKHDLRRKFPTDTSTSGDEDIAAIAKQISDHAEAIYQTWKSRGLAPTEILNCHSNATAADKFGSALTPTSPSNTSNNNEKNSPTGDAPTTAVDILTQTPNLDNGNLEKLVNNFVQQQQQQQAQTSPLKSSSVGSQAKTKPGNVLLSPTSPFANKPSQIVKPQVSTKTPGAHHREVFLETIETTFPADITPSKIVVQQKRPTSTVITSPTASSLEESSMNSGLTTWPLKNKLNDSKRVTEASTKAALIQEVKSLVNKEEKRNSGGSNSSAYLDEVAREEERLINALKTGSVITEEPTERTVPLTRQKPAIKREKPKVEPVKPIIIGHNHHGGGLVPTSVAMVNNVTSTTPGSNVGAASDAKSLSKDDLSSMSVVDYAKVRYRAAQQNPPTQQRLEEQRTNNTFSSTEQLVSTTRSKFETEIRKDKESAKEEKDPVTSRWGPRINSPRPRIEQVPHPELTTQQKQHIRAAAATGTGNNPIRPFLTRGSVAERVLIFEKCPSELLLDKRGPRQPAINTWRTGHEVQNKAQTYAKDKTQQKSLPPHTTLQRHVKANRNVHIPRFYFPGGKPLPLSQVEATIARITAAFQSLPDHRASRSQFHTITKACDLPLYWKVPLFLAAGGDQTGYVEMNAFLDFWKEISNSHHDAASKFIRITTRGQRNNILPEDLIPLVQDVVETHPGLTFLKEATEFHSRYVHTVIARIFYCVNRSWSGRISVAELRRSNLLSVIAILENEEDINQVTAYFSYEHFYVIYCKFWELDRDHDLFIDKTDLTKHNDHALSKRMIARIFSGAVTRGGVKSGNGVQQPQDKMSYTEFVWFLLSEEDKNHPTAIEYWFRCMDLDGDGYLSMYELEYFYEEQLHRMEAIGLETLPFKDCLCQMLDMIKPATPGKISLSDLKKCKMTSIFFDTFFNLEKYLDHEQRDPFASAREHDSDGHELSDWDRFAAEEYELLVTEESGNEQNEQKSIDSMSEDVFSQNLEIMDGESVDMLHNTDIQAQSWDQDNPDDLQSMDQADSLQQSRNQYYDSGDSDDYAESDN